MPGKQIEHVIKKRQPSTDAGLAATIEVELHTDIGLFGFTLDLRHSRCGLRQMVFGFFHKSLPHWNGVSTGSGSSDRIQAQSVHPEINPVATAPGTDTYPKRCATLASALQIFPSMTRATDRSPRASPRSNESIHSTSDNCSRPESEYFG